MTASYIPVAGTTQKLQTFANDLGAGAVDAEAVTIVDSNGVAVPIATTAPGFSGSGISVRIAGDNGTGTWNYASGTLMGAGTVTGVGRCIGIRVFASGADGSFNIGGGNTITVRSGAGVDINPNGNISAPVVNWVSGTLDVVIQGVS